MLSACNYSDFINTDSDTDANEKPGSGAPPVADSIQAIADTVQTVANTTLSAIDVTANDTGLDNTIVTVTLESNPSHGSVSISNNMFSYVPESDFVGFDSFQYKITVDSGASAVGTVSVTINEPPDSNEPSEPDHKPVAQNDSIEVSANSEASVINVLANDSGLEDAPVDVVVSGDAGHGTVTKNSDNAFSYTPDQGFSGADSFSYQVIDADGDADTATVSVFVIEEPQNNSSPKLEGYGTTSRFGGGAGSETCIVTNLKDSGEGSFRECVEDRNGPVTNPTPRTIQFDVSGTIVLQTDVSIRQPYLTIDGLDAPSPGITFAKTGDGIDGGVEITTWSRQNTCGHDVLVQGVRFKGVWNGESEQHSQKAETIVVDGEDLPGCLKKVVLNRITVTNAQDAGGDIWGSVEDVTVQYSAFLKSLHPNTISHSSGQRRERISNHHNLYAYIYERGPQLRGSVSDFNFEQNIIHKWGAYDFGGGYATRLRCRYDYCPERLNFIENHWTSGGRRLDSAFILGDVAGKDADETVMTSEVYMQGNYLPTTNIDKGTATSEFGRAAEARVTLFQDKELVSRVLPNIGMPYRTQEEEAIFSEVANQIEADQ